MRLLIILYGDDPEEFRFNDRCEVYEHEGSGFPMGFADNRVTLTTDHDEMLTANFGASVATTFTWRRYFGPSARESTRHLAPT